MTTQIQRRRGTTAQHSTFTGAVGEVTVDTDKEVLVVHDGAQVGGYPQMRENGSNSALALGSAGTPSLKFAGDTNTGIYSPGADQLALSTNGTGRLFVDANGDASIGSLAPLTVTNYTTLAINGGNGGNIVLRNTANTTSAEFRHQGGTGTFLGTITNHPLMFQTNNTERLRITSAGFVGVGTSVPDTALHVVGTGTFTTGVSVGSGIERAGLGAGVVSFYNAGASNKFIRLADDASTINAITFAKSGSTATVSFPSGPVGIGTTSPVYPLHVEGTGATPGRLYLGNSLEGLATGTNNGGAIYFGINPTSATTATAAIESSWGGSTNPQIHMGVTRDGNKTRFSAFSDFTARIYTGNNERVRIDSNGQFNLSSNASTAPFVVNIGSSEVSRIDGSGRLLVGTSSARAVAGNFGGTTNQILFETVDVASFSAVGNKNDSSGPIIALGKSRSGSVGGVTAVQAEDILGAIKFAGANGTDLSNIGAEISAVVDGTPFSSGDTTDLPGRLVFSTTADGASSPTERLRITNDGVQCYNQPAPTSKSAAATLTIAELKTGIIQYTGAADTLTLPTGTLTEGGFAGIYTNMTFEWSVINTGSGTCTVGAGSGHTIVGSATIAAGDSGRFASRRTAANTFVTYRLS